MDYQHAIEVLRGDRIESLHYAAAAIVDKDSNLVASLGSPDTTTFMRSSAKPFQVVPLIEQRGIQRYGFSQKEIAIMCASHSGTDDHVRTVASILEKIGLDESHLLCGTHPPMHEPTADRLKINGIEPTPLRHNCSGKHAGMLALSKLLGSPTDDYLNVSHPVQIQILETISDFCDLDSTQIEIGIDGCSVPTFAVPLQSAALAFARLADPVSFEENRYGACRTVWKAMAAFPEMVAGLGRFDTALMRIAGGSLVTKGGAEGYQGIAITPGAYDEGSPALGIAVKIADGDGASRARSLVTLKILEELKVLAGGQLEDMAKFGGRKRFNLRNIEVGELRPCFQLERPVLS